MSVLIIAEAGVNAGNDIVLAKKLALTAKECGADMVKFQTAIPELVISRFAQKAQYQKNSEADVENQLQMVRKLHLSFSEHTALKRYCDSIGIPYLSTPFDLESVGFLDILSLPLFKIPSGEITNLPYLIKIANTGKPILLSTGMCEISEIEDAVKVLKKHSAGEITLLHCNTEYPTPPQDANLLAINHLKNHFKLKVGYSDHTLGIEAPIAAVALGAVVIEKHFTLDKSMQGPDHKASMSPDELKAMVKAIRYTEKALGSGVKHVTPSEQKNIAIARKSIVASCFIKKGDMFSEQNITVKRAGNGVSPMRWFEVMGIRAKKDFVQDEAIKL